MMLLNALIAWSFCYSIGGIAATEIIDGGCDSTMHSVITNAFRDTQDMLQNAVGRFQQLRNSILNDTWTYPVLSHKQCSTRRTIASMIDPTLDAIGRGRTRKRELMSSVDSLLNTSSVMLRNIGQLRPENLGVTCSPAEWILPIPDKGPNTFLVTRSDEQKVYRLPWGLDPFLRRGNDSILVFHDMPGLHRSVLLLNENNKGSWFHPEPDERRLRVSNDASADDVALRVYDVTLRTLRHWRAFRRIGVLSLESFMSHDLATDLLDALSRLDSIVEDETANTHRLWSQPCFHSKADPHNALEWECVKWLAKLHPKKTLKSSVTFKYLITALFLDQWDWSLGVNRRFVDCKIPGSRSRKSFHA